MLILFFILNSIKCEVNFNIYVLCFVPQLDKEEEAFDLDDEDDPDFYQQAHMPI